MLTILLTVMQETRIVVVNEYRRGLIGWIIIGLIAGWLAGKISRGEGYGCIADIILGLVGSLLGGWIFTRLGILVGGFCFLWRLPLLALLSSFPSCTSSPA